MARKSQIIDFEAEARQHVDSLHRQIVQPVPLSCSYVRCQRTGHHNRVFHLGRVRMGRAGYMDWLCGHGGLARVGQYRHGHLALYVIDP